MILSRRASRTLLAILSCCFLLPTAVLAQRAPVEAKHGMVASASALATQIGVDVLKEGGNAADAAVATALALAVTYPRAGNLGGGGFAVIRLADGTLTAVDFRETAPARATRELFLDAQPKASDNPLIPSLETSLARPT